MCALTRLITAAVFAGLPDLLKKEYSAQPDAAGNHVLDLTDYEDPAALKRAKDHEKEARKAAEKASKELQDQLNALTEERDEMLRGNVKKDDVAKLEKSWGDKLAAKEKELNGTIATLQATVQTTLVDNVAQSIANEISTAPSVIMPHIKSRLKTEQVDGKFITKVLGADGSPSALTVDELKQEFRLNKDFAAIITASKASGGGAGGAKGGGGSGAGAKIDFSKSPKDVAAALAAKHNLPTATV